MDNPTDKVLTAIDTVSNYAEEIDWHMKHPLIQLLDEFYSEIEQDNEGQEDTSQDEDQE